MSRTKDVFGTNLCLPECIHDEDECKPWTWLCEKFVGLVAGSFENVEIDRLTDLLKCSHSLFNIIRSLKATSKVYGDNIEKLLPDDVKEMRPKFDNDPQWDVRMSFMIRNLHRFGQEDLHFYAQIYVYIKFSRMRCHDAALERFKKIINEEDISYPDLSVFDEPRYKPPPDTMENLDKLERSIRTLLHHHEKCKEVKGLMSDDDSEPTEAPQPAPEANGANNQSGKTVEDFPELIVLDFEHHAVDPAHTAARDGNSVRPKDIAPRPAKKADDDGNLCMESSNHARNSNSMTTNKKAQQPVGEADNINKSNSKQTPEIILMEYEGDSPLRVLKRASDSYGVNLEWNIRRENGSYVCRISFHGSIKAASDFDEVIARKKATQLLFNSISKIYPVKKLAKKRKSSLRKDSSRIQSKKSNQKPFPKKRVSFVVE